MEKVFIIEDEEPHFLEVYECLKEYNIECYPKDIDEFFVFSDLLSKWALTANEKRLEEIQEIILAQNANYYIFDVNLKNTSDTSDRSGLLLRDYVMANFDNCTKFLYTRYNNIADMGEFDGHILKNEGGSIQSQVYEKIVEVYFPMHVISIVKKAQTDYKKPKALIWLLDKENYKLLPWVSFIIDNTVRYSFYLLLTVLFCYAPIYIFQHMANGLIQVAEYTFIAFLPFLISCGFYVFYMKSLRPYFLREAVDPRKESFDSASVLMRLTKKLFISSLLSYLFIKLIELLYFEAPKNSTNYFKEVYDPQNKFTQLYFVAGTIVILILYYIYIDKNHSNEPILIHEEKKASEK